MRRRRLRALALVLLALALPGTAAGWGVTGHRVVGEIAEGRLDPAARARVREILGVEDLAEASTWPDFMRASDAPFWRRAAPWHYVTIPPGSTWAEAGPPPEGDAISALARFRAELLDPAASTQARRRALRFIVHLVGDLHQPLHAGNGRDRGGNDVSVTFFGRPMSLHALWDTALVRHEALSYREMAAWLDRRITDDRAAAWAVTDPVVWAEESAALREGIYPDPPAALGYDYVFAHRDTVRLRLSQAGVRLAAYLNALFTDRRAAPTPPQR